MYGILSSCAARASCRRAERRGRGGPRASASTAVLETEGVLGDARGRGRRCPARQGGQRLQSPVDNSVSRQPTRAQRATTRRRTLETVDREAVDAHALGRERVPDLRELVDHVAACDEPGPTSVPKRLTQRLRRKPPVDDSPSDFRYLISGPAEGEVGSTVSHPGRGPVRQARQARTHGCCRPSRRSGCPPRPRPWRTRRKAAG